MKVISFLLALCVCLVILIYPRIIATDMHSVSHGWLVLMFLGVSCSFVYGVGFKPDNKILRFIFSPWVGWTLIAIGGAMLLLHSPILHNLH